ncbi:unnamed protein product [Hyaloperonospora brassicae]|uniref:Uncharacterized protein n=1 Tax=Hyaloperonospora brassicae TaxID=162125 RepID=A0AAV0T2L9_HYABA|nr:unnamed protein product [Hyaloperonospora brassicae]
MPMASRKPTSQRYDGATVPQQAPYIGSICAHHSCCRKRRRVGITSDDVHVVFYTVIAVAVLCATYRLFQLEHKRDQRQTDIEHNTHLDSKYRVLRVVPSPHSVITLHAIVINSGVAVPHVEAEVIVDQQHVLDQQRKHTDQRRRARHPLPFVRFHVHDAGAMTPIAEVSFLVLV